MIRQNATYDLAPLQRCLIALLGLTFIGLVYSGIPPAFAAAQPGQDLTDLSLEELMDIEVTSVSKKPQSVAHTASAIFVITQDDIRRSGANNPSVS